MADKQIAKPRQQQKTIRQMLEGHAAATAAEAAKVMDV